MKRVEMNRNNESLLVRYMGDTAKIRVIDFFLDNPSEYTKHEVLKNTGISKTTLYNIWDDLIKYGILKETKKIGNIRLFALNLENPITRQLKELDTVLVLYHTKRCSE